MEKVSILIISSSLLDSVSYKFAIYEMVKNPNAIEIFTQMTDFDTIEKFPLLILDLSGFQEKEHKMVLGQFTGFKGQIIMLIWKKHIQSPMVQLFENAILIHPDTAYTEFKNVVLNAIYKLM